MGNVLTPPSTNVPIVQDRDRQAANIRLTMPWHKWFLDVAEILNKSGGQGGAQALIDAHVAEADPHAQYLTNAEAYPLYSSRSYTFFVSG